MTFHHKQNGRSSGTCFVSMSENLKFNPKESLGWEVNASTEMVWRLCWSEVGMVHVPFDCFSWQSASFIALTLVSLYLFTWSEIVQRSDQPQNGILWCLIAFWPPQKLPSQGEVCQGSCTLRGCQGYCTHPSEGCALRIILFCRHRGFVEGPRTP